MGYVVPLSHPTTSDRQEAGKQSTDNQGNDRLLGSQAVREQGASSSVRRDAHAADAPIDKV